ncbi:MAG: tRNA (N(6)-L-threonylcarbamoyladenosine(37)-C(2))-methylthiotransferase MtaB [Oscillospiraceae bacterium]|nr:tRNA (N(6)-L-threonylcarbamoyladenosine(37)-C(2))-methylthiotransferase MtaB [Oscillospiraceae bacterium]
MRAAFYTLGCKVNQYETSIMTEAFLAAGFEIVNHSVSADVYILNSCTVTEESDRKMRRVLRRMRRQNPNAAICLCGCMPQAFPGLAAQIPEADIVLGTKNRADVLSAVYAYLDGGKKHVGVTEYTPGDGFEASIVASSDGRTRAFVKIQDGCERFCAYCIVPHARGHVRSKPLRDIETELNGLAGAGYREIVLTGVNLSSYGADIGAGFADAVTLACGIPGIERVRLGSLEPDLFTDETVMRLRGLPGLCPQFHLSLQSGCDATLRRMRRLYTADDYRRIVGSIRASFKNAAITGDIMVGFPGETDEEFAQSLDFVREIGFARAHVFAYSRRPGTPAADMPGQIPPAEKTARSKIMTRAAEKSRGDFLESQVGISVNVLFESQKPGGMWEGYSENYTRVQASSPANIAGRIIRVTLTRTQEDSCIGAFV